MMTHSDLLKQEILSTLIIMCVAVELCPRRFSPLPPKTHGCLVSMWHGIRFYFRLRSFYLFLCCCAVLKSSKREATSLTPLQSVWPELNEILAIPNAIALKDTSWGMACLVPYSKALVAKQNFLSVTLALTRVLPIVRQILVHF